MDTGGTIFLPPQHSTFAGQVDSLFCFIMYASIVFFAIVVGGIVYFSLRYRRRQRVGVTPEVHESPALELIWTLIPIALSAVVFYWAFHLFIQMSVPPKDALDIKVTGQKWFWSFEYPNGKTSMSVMEVPVNKPVRLLMSSRDVIHGFFIPDFRIKQDVLPDRYTITWFQATDTGTFNIFCTQYCGQGHSTMHATAVVVPEAEYAQWLESGGGGEEGVSLEALGEQLYKSKTCVTCHSIDGTPLVGPTWKGIYGNYAKFTTGDSALVDENYIRGYILKPNFKVIMGYQPVMPTFQGILTDHELDALVAYIKSLK